jgi:hypothetical protein
MPDDDEGAEQPTVAGESDATTIVPGPTQAAPELAWSQDDGEDDDESTWRHALMDAAKPLFAFALIAVVAVGVGAWLTFGRDAVPSTTSVPTPAPALSPQSSPDDNGYVALAISVSDLPIGGFGVGESQQKANQIALGECRARAHDCVLADAGAHHGCVAVAYNRAEHSYASGSGATITDATGDAVRRFGVDAPTVGQCSDPPGVIRATPPPAAPKATEPAPAPPTTVTATQAPHAPAMPTTAPDDDAAFRRFVLQIPGMRVVNWDIAESGARGVCHYLGQGHSHDDAAAQVLRDDPTFTPWQASAMVNASVSAYCPQYEQ